MRVLTGTSIALLAFCMGPSVAFAQSSGDALAARTLFQDARKLAEQGKYAQACPKFEESLGLDRGIGTMFNLADCWEHIGRTASAWSEFLDAASAAKNAGQGTREKVARHRAEALEPHLSRLVIRVPTAESGLAVRDALRAVPPSVFGTAVPVDPGPHTIEATAPGKKRWEDVVQIGGDAALVTVSVPALADDETASKTVPAQATPSVAPAATEARPTASRGGQWTAGWVTAGVGVAATAVGAVFGVITISKNNEALGLCTTPCTTPGVAEHQRVVDDAKSARTASIVAFSVGGAALVGAVVLLLTSPKTREGAEQAARIAPAVGPGELGATFRGAF